MELKNIRIEGVEGELRIEFGAFSPKLYQDGKELKGKASKFQVTNDKGEQEELKLLGRASGLDFTYKVEFRGKKIQLEEKLTTLQYIMGLVPLMLVFIGGAIGGIIGAVGTMTIYNYMRKTTGVFKQVLIALFVSIICIGLYFIIALIINFLFHG